MRLQSIADNVCDKYKVPRIPVKVTPNHLNKGLAYYATYRIKRNGRIEPKNHPRYIVIGNYAGDRLPIMELSHELAHHILNVRHNSLSHTIKHADLEDNIGIYIYRLNKTETVKC